jgi:hypothetical protein
MTVHDQLMRYFLPTLIGFESLTAPTHLGIVARLFRKIGHLCVIFAHGAAVLDFYWQ